MLAQRSKELLGRYRRGEPVPEGCPLQRAFSGHQICEEEMRDEFPKPVADTLTKRVGNRCSNPDCRKRTSGPHTEDDKALNVGVAAHITAASPGGPRFDSSLTSDERKGIGNGIWLCQSCTKLAEDYEYQRSEKNAGNFHYEIWEEADTAVIRMREAKP